MNKPAVVLRSPRPPESDVHKIGRRVDAPAPDVVDLAAAIAAPVRRLDTAPCEELAKTAMNLLAAGEHRRARRHADDAFVVITALSESRRDGDRALAASAALTAGDVFLALDAPDAADNARDCFDVALRYFGDGRDPVRAARAERGLALALERGASQESA